MQEKNKGHICLIGRSVKPPNFALGEKVIPSVDQCKYLGIIICVKNCDADFKKCR